MKIYCLKLFACAVLILSSFGTWAACTNVANVTINPATPMVFSGQADASYIGQSINNSWGGTTSVPTVFGSCGSTSLKAYIIPVDAPTGVKYTQDGYTYDVYPTGVAGIGYVVGVKDTHASVYLPMSTPYYQTYPCSGCAGPAPMSIGYSAQVIYVATNTLVSGTYVIPTKVVANLTVTDLNGVSQAAPATLTITGSTINVTALSCNINNSNLTVPLGNINASSFTGVGVVVAERQFDVDLNCAAGARINVSLQGTQSGETVDNSVLALSGAGSQGVATGVGVQILYAGSVVARNNNILLKTSAGGGERLSFSARYYQTRNQVTAGQANALATLTVIYR